MRKTSVAMIMGVVMVTDCDAHQCLERGRSQGVKECAGGVEEDLAKRSGRNVCHCEGSKWGVKIVQRGDSALTGICMGAYIVSHHKDCIAWSSFGNFFRNFASL